MKCALLPQRSTSKMHYRRTRCIGTWNYSRISGPWRIEQKQVSEKTLAAKQTITQTSCSYKQSLHFEHSFSDLVLPTWIHLPQWYPSSTSHKFTLPGSVQGFAYFVSPATMWSVSFVDLKKFDSVFSSLLSLLSSLSSDSHASCPSPPPHHSPSSFSFLLFCYSRWWWEALFLRAFTPGRPLPGFWRTLIRDDAAVAKPYKLFQE